MKRLVDYERFKKDIDCITDEMMSIFKKKIDIIEKEHNPSTDDANINFTMYGTATVSAIVVSMFNAIGNTEFCRKFWSIICESVFNSLYEAKQVHVKHEKTGIH